MSREAIMTALLNKLSGALVSSFTADTDGTTGVLKNVSSEAGLFLGLPVFGLGIAAGAVIQTIDSPTQVTLSLPTSAVASGAALTTGFQTTGRRLLLWSKVAAQPALFIRNIGDKYERREGQPPRVTLRAEIWVYSQAGKNPDLAPAVALNNIVDALEAALVPDNIVLNRLTLGGLVQHCWIEGNSTFDPGDLDGQAKALIPLSILVP